VQPMGIERRTRSRSRHSGKVGIHGPPIHLPKCATASKGYISDPADRVSSSSSTPRRVPPRLLFTNQGVAPRAADGTERRVQVPPLARY
jgi:hypothetical protein